MSKAAAMQTTREHPRSTIRPLPTEAANFVAGEINIGLAKREVAPPRRAKTSRKRVMERVHKGPQDVIQIYFPLDLGTRLRHFAAGERLSLSDAVICAVQNYLAGRGYHS